MTQIPEKAFTQHTAILGKTGSGKTYTAKGLVEALLAAKKRCCILDPTGVWWGLKSSASGKRAAYPVVVFGGSHADVPLGHTHGAAIAEIIGTTDISAIIDTEQMTVGERTRFFTDFAETLLRKNKGPLNLILDECHVFAPQGKIPDPQAGRMLHAANNMVSLGRSKGLRITMISQRPAKLHKDSLTQAGTLIAMRLMAPQDREAVKAWISEWADQAKGQEIMQSLPGLPIGTGWVWSPEADFLKRVQFPKITTYDSSAAPDGEREDVVLASIDLPSIEQRLQAVSKDALDNDPKRLQAKIAELQRAAKNVAPATDPQAIAKARTEGMQAGYSAGFSAAIKKISPGTPILVEMAKSAVMLAEKIQELAAGDPPKAQNPVLFPPYSPKRQSENAVLSKHRANAPKKSEVSSLPAPQKRIIDAIALLETLGVKNIQKNHVAAVAGASPTSSAYSNNLGRLRTEGFIDYPRPGELCLTERGVNDADYPTTPPTVNDLHQAWLRLVPGPQGKILQALIEQYPEAAPKEALAEQVGASATSSAYSNNLGALRSLGVIEYPQKGFVVATDILFPEAA